MEIDKGSPTAAEAGRKRPRAAPPKTAKQHKAENAPKKRSKASSHSSKKKASTSSAASLQPDISPVATMVETQQRSFGRAASAPATEDASAPRSPTDVHAMVAAPSPVATSPLRRRARPNALPELNHATALPASPAVPHTNDSESATDAASITDAAATPPSLRVGENTNTRPQTSSCTYLFLLVLCVGWLLLLTNLVTLSFWMQERSAVARHVAAVVSSPAVVDTAALQQQQQQQVEALTTERNEAVQQAQQLQETLDTVVVTHTADEEVWQAVQPLLEAQVRMQATRLQGLEEQIAQFTAEKHATEEQGRRLQADMDELWEQAQGLQQNRNDWEDLARRFEEETIPAREAELLQSRDFAKELQKRASEYAAEVERLRNTVFGLEEEKKVLLAKLA